MPPRYGRLEIPVVPGDLPQFERAVRGAATSAGQAASNDISKALGAGLKASGNALRSVGRAAASGLTVATTAAVGFGVASFRTAARVDEMNASLKALAAANKLSYPEMQRQVTAIRRSGIEAGVAQNVVAQFARNQLDLASASKLARVAQDAAVISGRNSSEVLDDLIHGISTQNSLVLRNAGVNVQAGQAIDAYARSVGKSVRELTNAERANAVLNAVMAEGQNVAGAYAAAMEEPGKVLRSFPRLFDDIKLSVGQGLVQAFGPVILQLYSLTKAFSEAIDTGGVLEPVFTALGDAVKTLTAPLAPMIERWTAWVKNLRPEQVERITEAIRRFGPVVMIAAGALTAMVAPSILGGIPVIGNLVGGLTAPAKLAASGLGNVAKALTVQLIPSLGGAIGPVGGLAGALGSALLPITAIAAALAVLMLRSEPFRRSVMGLVRAIGGFFTPIVQALMGAFRELIPPLDQIVRKIGEQLAPVIDRLSPLLGPLGRLIGAVLTLGFKNLGIAIRLMLPVTLQLLNVLGFLLRIVANVVAGVARLAIAVVSLVVALARVINPFSVVVTACSAVVRAFQAVWRWITGGSPGLIPAFNALGATVSAVIGSVVGVVRSGFSAVTTAMSALTSATRTAMNAITSVISAGWSRALANTRASWNAKASAISSAWSAIGSRTGSATSWLTSTIASAYSRMLANTRASWSAKAAAISNAWGQIGDRSRSAIGWLTGFLAQAWTSIYNTAMSAWGRLVQGAASTFDRLRDAIRSPVAWVVNNVINRLINGINALITKISLPAIPTIPGFAAGGRVPGGWGGGDRRLIMAEAGEWVLTKRQARAMGYGNLARLPRYAQGGEVGPGTIDRPNPRISLPSLKDIGGAFARITHLDQLAGLGKDLVDGFTGMLSWMAAQAFQVLAEPLKKLVEPWAGDAQVFPKQWLGKLLPGIIDSAVQFITGKATPVYEGGGANVDVLAQEVMRNFPGLMITSALRRGDPGYHGRNLARDLGGPVAVMNAAGAWMARTMVSALLEGIHNPTLSVKNGALVASSFWGAGTWAGHRDHIHMAAQEGSGSGAAGTFAGPGGSGVARWRPLVTQIAGMFGIGHTVDAWMRQIATESGGNERVIQQIRDVNWPNNLARGLLQVIPTTFAAQRGNPFGNNPLDPRANIWAAMSYATKRYGARLLSVIGRGHGYAGGGIIGEPVLGFGLRSMTPYTFAERGPELVSPLAGATVPGGRAAGATINVYPQPGQDPLEIARMVSRELAWAAAGGAT